MSEKIVGVIGGMGPEATVEFLRRLVAATPAEDDADHLHVLIDNNPKIPSRIKALIEGSGADPAPVLRDMARKLESQGAELLAMPCNTAHHYLPQIADAVKIPVLDMVQLSVERLKSLPQPPKNVGVLATPAVRMVGLYDAKLKAAGFRPIFPGQADEALLLQVIRAVKAGKLDDARRRDYAAIIGRMADADIFLIACTELSILEAPAKGAIDALDVLVEAVIKEAVVPLPPPSPPPSR
jgi:aspartate racemase